MRVLVVDNYDSFTYNLVQYLGELGAEPIVWRNDRFRLEEVEALDPDRILISPGPCTPFEAGLSIPLIQRYAPRYPILGVCLGHQAIGAAFGGKVVPAPVLMHGKVSPIHHDGRTPAPATAGFGGGGGAGGPRGERLGGGGGGADGDGLPPPGLPHPRGAVPPGKLPYGGG